MLEHLSTFCQKKVGYQNNSALVHTYIMYKPFDTTY